MDRRAILAAAATAVVGLSMLVLYMQRFEAEASGGPPVDVLVAREDIPLGTTVERDMLLRRPLPSSYVEERHIPASEVERVVGVRVTSGVRALESLLWTDLALATEQRRDLSSLVQPGMRAITIRADVSASFGGLLRPGDRVDVLLTTRPTPQGAHVTIPLLQNVLALAAGRDTGGPDRPGETRRDRGGLNQVTLSVTLEQASVLALAQSRGRLTLALRNPDDITVVDRLPETTAEDIIEPDRRARVQRRELPAEPTGRPERVHVEP